MDKNIYLDLWNSFETQRERGIIKDQYFLDLESHYVMVLTMNDGQRLGVRMLLREFSDNITPIEILPIASGRRLEIVKAEDALAEWQRINFPQTDIHIFDGYTEFDMFDSLREKTVVPVCGKLYKVVDLLGYGKESRVFKAVDAKTDEAVALKTGFISLEKEVNYIEDIKRKLKGHKATDLFLDYLIFDKGKNIIVMEYLEGQTLDDYISQKLEAEENLEQLLLLYADVVQKVCELKEDHDVLYGQFYLRNIIIDQKGSTRFIDPLYTLSLEKYDTLQIIRIGAILMETFYGLRDNNLPEKTKRAVGLEELRRVSISDSLLDKLEESCLPTKDLIDYKVKDIIRKCLIPKLRLKSLSELKEQFEELENLVYAYSLALNQERKDKIELGMLRKFETYMERKYLAVALDFNNTISFTEETDKYVLEKIAQLLGRGIHVAIISGRRSVWIDSFIREIQPFLRSKENNTLKYLHFYNSEGAIGCNVGTGKIYYEKLFDPEPMKRAKKLVRRNFPQIDFQTHFRTDGYRLNFDFVVGVNELNEFFKKKGLPVNAVTSGTSIDVVPYGTSKGVALTDFTLRLDISIDDVVKVADQGQRNGNDNSFLSGFGAFSVNNYEPSSNQVSTFEVLGLRKVFATAWLLDNLKFVEES